MGYDPLINKKVCTLFENFQTSKAICITTHKKNISSTSYVSNKESDGTHVFSAIQIIISNLGGLLLHPFSMTGYLFNLLCHSSFLVMEQGIIGDQYFIAGC